MGSSALPALLGGIAALAGHFLLLAPEPGKREKGLDARESGTFLGTQRGDANATDVIRALLTESGILARDFQKVKKLLQAKGLGVACKLQAPGITRRAMSRATSRIPSITSRRCASSSRSVGMEVLTATRLPSGVMPT